MTAQPIEQPSKPVWPAKTLGDITRVITANATVDVVAEFTAALDAAWAGAKTKDSLEPLRNLIEGWWPQAVFWVDREAALRTMARVEDFVANGVPPEARGNALDTVAKLRAKHGQHPTWDALERLAARH